MASENRENNQTSSDLSDDFSATKNKKFHLCCVVVVAGLGAAALVGFSYYVDMREHDTAQAVQTTAQALRGGVIPSSEAEAADRAQISSDEQTKGMTAPADFGTDNASEASAVSASAASSVADELLADLQPENDNMKTVLEKDGSVHFYFAPEETYIADDSISSLKDILAGVKSGKKVEISGFYDTPADSHLMRERVLAVRDLLLAEGVPESQIVLHEAKPVQKEQKYHVSLNLQWFSGSLKI